jgi:hypothetical protein
MQACKILGLTVGHGLAGHPAMPALTSGETRGAFDISISPHYGGGFDDAQATR